MSRFLEHCLRFGRALRQAGIGGSLEQTLTFARALDHVDVGDREQLFHAARSCLVNRHEDLELFERVFEQFWSECPAEQAAPLWSGLTAGRKRLAGLSVHAVQGEPDETQIEIADRRQTYSATEVLRQKDFALLTPEEHEQIRRLIRDTRWQMSQRRTRRTISARRGSRVHLRRMLRDAARFGGWSPRLRFLRPKIKQRPVVLLADVSGSMEQYSRLLLQFFYGVTQSLPDVECFAFGTRLTRVTPQLRLRNVDHALDETSRRIFDWSGGTRIGESLATFNREWSRRVLSRGAVVIVASDGWERGDVEELGREMRYLQRRSYRLIWLNPYLGQPGFEPRVAGMTAALPYVDDFLSIRNLDSLRALSRRLRALPPRRTGLPATAAAR